MVEISHRPWSPLVERAWVALHSSWLIPPQTHTDNNLRIWIPLRKLLYKARKHRAVEIERLRADSQAATRLEMEDQKMPLPLSSGPFPNESSADAFRQLWRQLMGRTDSTREGTSTFGSSGASSADISMHRDYTPQPLANFVSESDAGSKIHSEPRNLGVGEHKVEQTPEHVNISYQEPVTTIHSSNDPGQTEAPSQRSFHATSATTDWSNEDNMRQEFTPWSFAEPDFLVDPLPDMDIDFMDANMDLEGDVSWYNWVEFAKSMERGAMQNPL